MAKFKIVLADPETGKSRMMEIEGSRAVPLISRRLGEIIDGAAIGLGGHKLKITGGSDKDGFPMRPDIHGGVRIGVIITKSIGFRATQKGERRRKTLRGSVITEDINQINMLIVEKPKKPKKIKKLEKKGKKKDKETVNSKNSEAIKQTEKTKKDSINYAEEEGETGG